MLLPEDLGEARTHDSRGHRVHADAGAELDGQLLGQVDQGGLRDVVDAEPTASPPTEAVFTMLPPCSAIQASNTSRDHMIGA